MNEDPTTLLDTFFSLCGNFINTSNKYYSEDSEKLIQGVDGGAR
jgi:aryl-alcohol dehydrogenase-like predicted oxidoreductase